MTGSNVSESRSTTSAARSKSLTRHPILDFGYGAGLSVFLYLTVVTSFILLPMLKPLGAVEIALFGATAVAMAAWGIAVRHSYRWFSIGWLFALAVTIAGIVVGWHMLVGS